MAVLTAAFCLLLLQTPPVPKPFPQPGQTTPPASAPAKPATPPASPAPQTTAPQASPLSVAPSGSPTAESLGAPLYPTAEYLESFDAGKGQRFFLFGSNAAFTEVAGYYKNVLKNGGRMIVEVPAMQQWDLAKFQEQTMAFPPSVVVKDYTWGGSTGYLFVNGTREQRFKTIIQIVPVAAVR